MAQGEGAVAMAEGGSLSQFVDALRFTPVFTTDWLEGQRDLSFRRVELEPGKHLLQAGERHPYMYHIASGLVRIYLLSDGGIAKTLFYHAAGTQFGFQGFREDGLTVSSAVAEVPSVVLAINYRDLLAFCDANPTYYKACIGYLFQITNSQTEEIANLSFQTGAQRLTALLYSLACSQQPAPAGGDEGGVAIPYTIDRLAEIIGAHRNTVSNALGQLRREGLVGRQAKPIVVTDVDGLARSLRTR